MAIVNVYCDEVFRSKSNNFMILGALFIKDSDMDRVLDQLENNRCLNTSNHKWNYSYDMCPKKESCKREWHDNNNTVIHFTEINRSRDRKIIADKWLTALKNSLNDKIKFKILVIDLDKLDCGRFGSHKVDLNIYNKFFRTLLKGGIRYLYYGEHVQIKCVYHDKGSQEKHDYFPELNLAKLELETSDSLSIQNKNIEFIDDDHRMYLNNGDYESVKHSQFIQLIDIILGSFSQLFSNLSENEGKKEVAENMREIIESIFDREWKYHHSISFFPQHSICELSKQGSITEMDKTTNEEYIDTALKLKDNFYNKRNLAMPKFTGKNQTTFASWM